MLVDTLNATLRLPDGRMLGYAEYGLRNGTPVLFVAGIGDSRLTRHPDATIAASLGIRLITIDRPGTGLSSLARYPHLVDWSNDLLILLDALHLAQPALLGWSLGAPYVLAAAAAHPDRFRSVGIVAGLAPFHRPGALQGVRGFVRWMPYGRHLPVWVARWLLFPLARQGQRHPERQVSPRYQDNPAMKAMLIATTREAWRQGSRGVAWDGMRVARPWGITLDAITVPAYLWYGGRDTLAPPQMGHYLAHTIPDAQLELYPAEGHGIIFSHWHAILRKLA